MNPSRRTFLKIAGLSLLGMGMQPALEARGEDELRRLTPNPQRLVGKRWAMVIDTKKFKTEGDYQRCIQACHRTHNVPEIGNPKKEVKWIRAENYEHAFSGQPSAHLPENIRKGPYLVLCNHCGNPPCVRVCPTKATFKRKDGIVMMDMHRCIGCRYCMVACPYGARSFNWVDPRPFIRETNPEFPTRAKGVVEKCNFCWERLALGLMPACVEASDGALIFGDLEDPDSGVRKILRSHFTIRRKPELGTEPNIYYVL